MAFKFILFAALACTASAALMQPHHLRDGGSELIQRQQNTFLDNQSNNNEQLRRQDEYLRNIDQSSDVIQNEFLRQQSNRLQDNEYRRTNWLYANNQQNRNIFQNQQQDQINRPRSNERSWWSHSQRYFEPVLVGQASSNNYPILRSWTSPYNSRVTFNSPLVSYQY